jgi:hypothetical protein
VTDRSGGAFSLRALAEEQSDHFLPCRVKNNPSAHGGKEGEKAALKKSM